MNRQHAELGRRSLQGRRRRGKERNVENGRSRKKEGRCKWVEVVEASGSTLDV
jgi:hypothetical protein